MKPFPTGSRKRIALASGVLLLGAAVLALLMNPQTRSLPAAAKPTIATLTVIPPAYTGIAAFDIKSGNLIAAAVPEGSFLRIETQDKDGAPVLGIGDTPAALEALENNIYTQEFTAPEDGVLTLSGTGKDPAKWRYTLTKDKAPALDTGEAPQSLPGGLIRVPLTVSDDYGGRMLSLRVSAAGEAVSFSAPVETRIIFGEPGNNKRMVQTFNLSGHPLAGREVLLTLEISDGRYQTARATLAPLVLPERQFADPAAAQIAALRKNFLDAAPGDYRETVRALEDILARPDRFSYQILPTLALRMATSRLWWSARDPETPDAVAQLLWDAAVGMEDGPMADALQRAREEKLALQQALRRPESSQERLVQKVWDLRNASAKYFGEVLREIHRRRQGSKQTNFLTPQTFSSMITASDTTAYFDALQAQIVSGDREAAGRALEDLQQALNIIAAAMDRSVPPAMQSAMQGTLALDTLLKIQKELLEKTREQSGSLTERQAAQNALIAALKKTRADLPDIADATDDVLIAMRQAVAAAQTADKDAVGAAQEKTVAAIDKARQKIADILAQMVRERMASFTNANEDKLLLKGFSDAPPPALPQAQ